MREEVLIAAACCVCFAAAKDLGAGVGRGAHELESHDEEN